MTDRVRRGLFASIAAVILIADGAAWSYAYGSGRIQTGALQLHPETMDGVAVTLSLVRVVTLTEDGFEARQGRFVYAVRSDAAVEVGKEVYARGVFHPPNHLDADWVLAAPARGGKKTLGFIGLGLTGLIVAAGTRVSKGGWGLRG